METKEKPARIQIEVSPDIHARFKAAVAAKGQKIKPVLEALVIEWLKKNEK